jgi:DNA-binding response OmpR family regulator
MTRTLSAGCEDLMKESTTAGGERPIDTVRSRILVVEDNARTQETIALYLRHAGYDVGLAGSGPDALAQAAREAPDLIVLDVMLPGLSGLDVCRALRERTDVPIILVTARTTEDDKLEGLGCGADDYVTKPFSPRELVARVRAVLRRSARAVEPAERIEVGALVLDLPRLRTTVAGRSVELTATEFQLLATMAREPGRVFTRAQLLDAVHGVAFDSYERAIDAHIKNIRRKLEPDPARPRFVETVYGVGYRVAEVEPA